MSDVVETFLSNRFNQLKNVIAQMREIGTKINEVTHDDNATIHYTVPMNDSKTCQVSLKGMVEEGNVLILDNALRFKRKEISSLLKEMQEVLDQV